MAKDQRKFSNYLKVSGLSKSYYLHMFAGGVAFLGIVMVYVSRLLNEVQAVVATLPDLEMVNGIQDRLLTVGVLFFLCFTAFMVSTVFYMIVLGQRVGGPVLAICSYIQELKKGNYDIQRSLRKNDELGAIMKELRELAEILKQKEQTH